MLKELQTEQGNDWMGLKNMMCERIGFIKKGQLEDAARQEGQRKAQEEQRQLAEIQQQAMALARAQLMTEMGMTTTATPATAAPTTAVPMDM